jgi:hypothetical protein
MHKCSEAIDGLKDKLKDAETREAATLQAAAGQIGIAKCAAIRAADISVAQEASFLEFQAALTETKDLPDGFRDKMFTILMDVYSNTKTAIDDEVIKVNNKRVREVDISGGDDDEPDICEVDEDGFEVDDDGSLFHRAAAQSPQEPGTPLDELLAKTNPTSFGPHTYARDEARTEAEPYDTDCFPEDWPTADAVRDFKKSKGGKAKGGGKAGGAASSTTSTGPKGSI